MGTKSIKVLHIGHSRKWRGGENQVRLLIEESVRQASDTQHFIAYPSAAIIFDRLQGVVAGSLELPSTSSADIRSIWRLYRFCKAHFINVIHAHSSKAHSLGLLVKKLIPSLRLVVHRRVDNVISNRGATKRKYLSDSVDAYICVSQKTQEMVSDFGVPPAKIHLIVDSIDKAPYQNLIKEVEKNKFCGEHSFDPKRPLVGFISALEDQKHPELFIESLAALKRSGVEFNALVAGAGSKLNTIERLVKEYDLQTSVAILGFVSDVEPLFSALDVFVLPSRNEGLGTVLLEAIAAETVIVASNVGGISEVVINRQTGLLVDAGQPQAFANAINDLFTDPDARQQIAARAMRHMNENFSLRLMAKGTERIYDALL